MFECANCGCELNEDTSTLDAFFCDSCYEDEFPETDNLQDDD